MLKHTMLAMVSLMAVVDVTLAQSGDAAKQQHALIGAAQSSSTAPICKDRARQWFPEAGLGLFIHWGLSSVDGYQELSWGMMANCPWSAPKALTPAAYWKLAEKFHPTQYDPERWLQAAKDAGFGYAALTTRHHDGYALWPSEYGDFNTKNNLDGRDLVREYVKACRKVGLKVGLYYSPPDWHFNRQYMSFGYGSKGTPESPHLGLQHEVVQLPDKPADFNDKYVAYVNGQVTELMTRYGKIDLLWFDGSPGKDLISQARIRAMQPDIVINDRGHGRGDYSTGFECKLPSHRPEGCWEYCGGLTGCWGYVLNDEKGDPDALAANLLTRLAMCRAWGGNVLGNCGPRPTGEMPECYYGCMEKIKTWMATRRESVIDVQAGPYPEQSNMPVTVRGKTWYALLLPDGHCTGPVVFKGVEKPRHATLLGTGQSMKLQFHEGTLTISVPTNLRTKSVDVVRVDW
jgi:alpha-L-fucosidase